MSKLLIPLLFLFILSPFAEAQIDSIKLDALASVKLLIKEKKYQEARTTYLELANRGVIDQATAYTKIGDLYMQTMKECLPPPEERDPVLNRVAYMAAYDMYEKAGNEKRMNIAKQALPSRFDIIHIEPGNTSYEAGKQTKVYGWIGGTATLRFRD